MPIRLGHHPLEHLPFGFEGVERFSPALKQGASALGKLHPLAQLEGVVIGDDDLGPFEVAKHIARNQFTALIVAVRIVGLKDAQAVTDRQAGRHDQKSAGELFAVWPAHGIDGLPGNQHGHDGGLARAGGQFQGQSHQFRIGIVIGIGQVFQKPASGLAYLRGHLGQPDERFQPPRSDRRMAGYR